MKDFLKNSLLVIIILSLTSSIGFTLDRYEYYPKNETYCDDTRPYVVGFFNGAGNTPESARKNMDALRKLYGRVQYGLPVKYKLFYNQTKGYHMDLLEIYAQKYEEMGLSVNGDQSFSELFFYINELSNGDNATLPDDELSKAIIELMKRSPELKAFISEIEPLINEKFIEKLTEMVKEEYNTVTVEDYKNHIKQLETLLDNGYKVILIGHSQGTLFVNHVYNKVVGDEDSRRHKMQDYVMPYYVAPVAAPETLHMYSGFESIRDKHLEYLGYSYSSYYSIHGYDIHLSNGIIKDIRYVLGSNDMVIKLLDLNTPIPNAGGAFELNNPLGHSLIKTYLKEGTEMRKRMEDFQHAFLIIKLKADYINHQKMLFSVELEKSTDSGFLIGLPLI